MVSFSQIMGIFDTYDLLPQSYKALPSNDTFCKYWVYETENLQKCTVSITDCLQNAYVYQLSGMVTTTFSDFQKAYEREIRYCDLRPKAPKLNSRPVYC